MAKQLEFEVEDSNGDQVVSWIEISAELDKVSNARAWDESMSPTEALNDLLDSGEVTGLRGEE